MIFPVSTRVNGQLANRFRHQVSRLLIIVSTNFPKQYMRDTGRQCSGFIEIFLLSMPVGKPFAAI